MLILSTPLFYSLELTPACNNACPGCNNVFGRERVPLSAAHWEEILALVHPHAHRLRLTGGEPTLHPQFEAIVDTLGERNLPFTLFTNARWSDPQGLIDLLQATPQCGGLLISLHGPDAATHEAFTHTPGSFEETCDNIRRATAAGVRVHTSTVLTRDNWDRVSEIVALAQKLGARRAVFNRYLGPPMPGLEPEESQLRRAMDDIESLRCRGIRHPASAISVKYGNCIPQCFKPSSSTGCWAGVAYVTIDPWGNLRPCNHSPLVLGNVLETSIEDLWQSKAMNRWRALLPDECKECDALSTCHGGCRAMIEIRNLERDPLARGALPIVERPPREVALWQGAKPRAAWAIRSEPFGYVLIRGQHFVPVTTQAQPILDALDGRTTLAEMQAQLGQEAVDFIGSLYTQGLVELA